MAEGQYRIFKAQLPLIGGIAGHNFLVLVAPDGRVIDELDGLATDADGNVKPIGYLPTDRLRYFRYPGGRYYRPERLQAEVASGDEATIRNLWNAADAAGNRVNARALRYPPLGLGPNSNSVLSTLIAAMGVAEPSTPDSAPIMPGEGTVLLDPNEIKEIQHQYRLDIPRPEGIQDVTPPSRSPGRIDRPDQQSASGVAKPPRGAAGPLTGRRTMSPPQSGSSGTAVSKPSDVTTPDGARSRSTGDAIRPTPTAPPARSGTSRSLDSPPTLGPLPFAAEESRNFGPFTAPSYSGFGVGNASSADGPIVGASEANAHAAISNGRSKASGPGTPSGTTGNNRASPIGDGNGIDDGWKSLVPTPFSASPTRDAPGGILGMLINAGHIDPANPDQPAPGGLLGLIQDYMRTNPVEGDYR